MKKIRLTQGKEALVDDEDYETLLEFAPKKCNKKINKDKDSGWYAQKQYRAKAEKYYAATNKWIPELKRQKIIFMHRIIMNPPKGMFVDHINGDGLDNRRENLRICTISQNTANSVRPSTNTSGYKGVQSSGRSTRPWKATIHAKGITKYLGAYRTKEEAAIAYDKKAVELYGEFAKLNFPNGVPSEIEKYIVKQNLQNNASKRKNNSSGYLGVIVEQRKHKQVYRARFGRISLGHFDVIELAAMARDKKAIELRGESVDLNFPDKKEEYLAIISKESIVEQKGGKVG